MNVFQYLATVTFAAVKDGIINVDKPFDARDIQAVQFTYEHFVSQCGDYSQPNSGELAKRYPGLFRDDIVRNFSPTSSPEHARFDLALQMMSNHICRYEAPRYDDRGDPVFSKSTGFQKARSMGKSYVIMEDLS